MSTQDFTGFYYTTQAKYDALKAAGQLVEGKMYLIQDGITDADTVGGYHAYQFIKKEDFDAKGDLIVGTADGAIVRLPVGVNGQVLVANSAEVPGIKWSTPDLNWIPTTETITYSSADAPNYVVGTSVDMTDRISIGMKIRLTHATVTKYFIVVKISTTTITLYGGTDYTLDATAIINFAYSTQRSPFGFPMSELKWTITTENISAASQANPVAGTWYNVGGNAPVVPIGEWKVSISNRVNCTRTAAGLAMSVSLSTANNTKGTDLFTNTFSLTSGTSAAQGYTIANQLLGVINVTTKTTYYLNAMATSTSTTLTIPYAHIRLICAYL